MSYIIGLALCIFVALLAVLLISAVITPIKLPPDVLAFVLNYFFIFKQINTSDFETDNIMLIIYLNAIFYTVVFLVALINEIIKSLKNKRKFNFFFFSYYTLYYMVFNTTLYFISLFLID